ncbi:MAG TPA: hypothetical protein VF622_11760 [Segetibacter sp.]|jgi:hypothetical protein
MNHNKPVPIRAEGLNVVSELIDEEDDLVKHTLIIYVDQFVNFSKNYVDHKGVLRLEIVKRKQPSSKGHDHWCRVATNKTNPCVTNGIIPKKPNELR